MWRSIALLAVPVVGPALIGYKVFDEVRRTISEDPRVWEKQIQAFEKKKRKEPVRKGAVVFVGSSTIRLWGTLVRDMAPLPAVQRGFGGAKINDVIHYMDRLITPHDPVIVVLYIGSNDMLDFGGNQAKSVDEMQRLYDELLSRLHDRLPRAKIVVLATFPSPLNAREADRIEAVNEFVRQAAEDRPWLELIDGNAALRTPKGDPDRSLFWFDRVHLNKKGYDRWAQILRPRLLELWLSSDGDEGESRLAPQQQAVELEHDPEFLSRIVPLMEQYGRYFDAEVRGAEHLPESGPALLVGNHSGPNCDPDTPVLLAQWYRRNGVENPLVVLSFDPIFAVPGAGGFFRRLAQVPANQRNAEAALDRGAAVLVYPGGLEDVARPWRERNQVVLAGHTGFIKLALRKGVPVVPVVGHGGHESSIVLTRGRRIAKALGLNKFRTYSMPLVFTIPWGVVVGPVPSVPIPTKVTLQVCEPMAWSHLGPQDAENPEVVDRCYAEITTRMQSALDDLAEEHPYPILSRLRSLLRQNDRNEPPSPSRGQ